MAHLQRRCVSCGRREHKGRLIRLCVRDGRVFWDRDGLNKGRGAYCHPLEECVVRLGKKGLLARSLHLNESDFGAEERKVLIQELLAAILNLES